jgi:hypothetical protein
MVNTDFQAGYANNFTAVYVTISAASKFPVNHAALVSVDGFGALGTAGGNNNGGRYGWVAFGELVLGAWYWHQRNDINYFNQVFTPPNANCGACRVWLVDGVQARFSSRIENAVTKYIQGLVQQILQYAAAAALKNASAKLVTANQQGAISVITQPGGLIGTSGTQ